MKKRIAELENRMFILEMKDHWTNEDTKIARQLERELNELKANLNK